MTLHQEIQQHLVRVAELSREQASLIADGRREIKFLKLLPQTPEVRAKIANIQRVDEYVISNWGERDRTVARAKEFLEASNGHPSN